MSVVKLWLFYIGGTTILEGHTLLYNSLFLDITIL